jgi:flagellar hook-associated protein 3 FlgL
LNISTAYQYQVYNSDINSAQNTMFQAQQQETTGLAINQPSDNPVGSQQIVSMQSIEDSLTQYQSNLSSAKDVLTTTESALQSAQQTMESAQTIALQGANGAALDSSTTQNLISQISTLQQSLVSIGNTQGSSGQYIFGGQQTSTAPFSVSSSGTLSFAGDNGSVSVQGGPNETIDVNVAGGDLFSNAYNALAGLKADLQSGDSAAISATDVSAITSASSAISDANGQMGAKADQVATLTSFNTQRITELTTSVSNVKDVNIATAATNYQAANNAYQAALTVVSKASSLSLMNYLSSTNL